MKRFLFIPLLVAIVAVVLCAWVVGSAGAEGCPNAYHPCAEHPVEPTTIDHPADIGDPLVIERPHVPDDHGTPIAPPAVPVPVEHVPFTG